MRFDRDLRRKIKDRVVTILAFLCVVVAIIPLASILYTSIVRGAQVLSIGFLTGAEPTEGCTVHPGVTCSYGGIGPAIEGTFVLIGMSALIAIPIGILIGIYISEYGGSRLGRIVSFSTEVMAGVPSIVIGVFVYSLFLLYDKSIIFSATTGSIALAIVMLPIVARTSEQALRQVPQSLREASLALGIPKHRTTLRVVLTAGRAALVTGAVLAVMRAGGETAPLLFTAFGNFRGFTGLNQPVEALPLIIFNWGTGPYGNEIADAWGAALVLILIMLSISIAARLVLRQRFGPTVNAVITTLPK
jgi:phosphate transport system permease protein